MSSFMKINKNDWKHFSPAGMEKLKEAVFAHYRLCGYPYYVLTDDEKKEELCKLIKYRHENLIVGPFIGHRMQLPPENWFAPPPAIISGIQNRRSSPLFTFRLGRQGATVPTRSLNCSGEYQQSSKLRRLLRFA